MAKPLKFHQTLNQAPRSMKHGKHRRAGAPAYGSPAQRTDHSAGGSDQADTVHYTWTTVSRSWFPVFTNTESKPPTIPYAGIRTGEIVGHRLWWIIREGGEQHLCSLAHRRLWLPNETISGDTKNPVNAGPWHTIWGGTYAFAEHIQCARETADLLEGIDQWETAKRNGSLFGLLWVGWEPREETSTFVVGTIKLWGDVVEHERGYRAEFAKLNSIDELHGPGDIDALRAKYGS